MLVKIFAAAVLFVAMSVVQAAPVAVTVSARVAAVAPDSVTVLWRLDMEDGWHVYGPFRNDTGFAPDFALELPAGWTAERPRWPVPERHVTAGEIVDHVYHGTLLVPQTLRRPAGAARGALAARVAWLECRQICIPRDTTLSLEVPARAAADAAEDLAAVLAALPGPLPAGEVQVTRSAEMVEIVAPGARKITAIPGPAGPLLTDLLTDGEAAGERLRLRLRPGTGQPGPWTLLLIIDHGPTRRTVGTIDLP